MFSNLSDDTLSQIFLYLPVADLYTISQCNKKCFTVFLLEYNWQVRCAAFGITLENSLAAATWRDAYKDWHSFSFGEWSPHLTMTNGNRTVADNATNRGNWCSARSKTMLRPGRIHRFQFVINRYDAASPNGFKVVFGFVENSNETFSKNFDGNAFCSVQSPKAIGVGYVPLSRGIYVDAMFQTMPEDTLANNDAIQFELDMTQVNELENEKLIQYNSDTKQYKKDMVPKVPLGTTMRLYHNNKHIQTLYHLQGMHFYPAVSMCSGHMVTLQRWEK